MLSFHSQLIIPTHSNSTNHVITNIWSDLYTAKDESLDLVKDPTAIEWLELCVMCPTKFSFGNSF